MICISVRAYGVWTLLKLCEIGSVVFSAVLCLLAKGTNLLWLSTKHLVYSGYNNSFLSQTSLKLLETCGTWIFFTSIADMKLKIY